MPNTNGTIDRQALARLAAGAVKKPGLLFALGLAGMALILFADLFDPADSKTTGTGEATAAFSGSAELTEYADRLSSRMEELLSGEIIYALDEKRGDAESYEWSHVILDDGTGDSALVETTWLPEVRGVAVVCQGGDDAAVQARLTEMVSVLLGVSTNRISIAKMS